MYTKPLRPKLRLAKASAPREPLPMREHYRIGEVSNWLGVTRHAMRCWEQWFDVRAARSKSGQRVYSRQQALLLGVIRELLYVELYTIEGAKRQLRLARERELGKESVA
jgi:DNA-binding transcriptional MerR regulator